MLKKIALGIIATVFVLSSGIVIGAKYGPAWRQQLARMEQHNVLLHAALRAEERKCELQALDVQLSRTSLRPVYVVPDWAAPNRNEPGAWFHDVHFACEGKDQYGQPVQSHIERPNCNRAAVEREWMQGGDFTVSLLGNCGVTPL